MMDIVKEASLTLCIVQCVLVDIMQTLEIQVVRFVLQGDTPLMQVIVAAFAHAATFLIQGRLVVYRAEKVILLLKRARVNVALVI